MKTAKQSIDLEYKGTKKRLNLRTALISLCMFAFVGTSAQTGTVTVKLRNASVKELFSAIEKQTSYRFSYRDAEIKGKGNVTISATNRELKQLLEGELSKLGLKYAVSGNKIIVTPVAAAPSAQPKKVTGKVVDANGEPVIGATIKEQGTANGTITDFDGNFTLDVADNAMLEVSYIGYKSQELKAVAGKTLSVTLREDTEVLDEVVVVGYGTTSNRKLVASVSTMKTDKVSDLPFTNNGSSLQGRVAGVIVQNSGGEPGSTPNIYIRGGGTPLYVIDGIIRDATDFNTLTSSDIENISVLKDASATAVYGAQAGNGIVLVTTKKGGSETPSIEYTGGFDWSKPTTLPEAATTKEITDFYNTVYRYDGYTSDFYTAEEVAKMSNTDWRKLALKNWGPTMRHNLSMSGKTAKGINYYTSIGYLDQGTIFKSDYNTYQRYNIRSSVSNTFDKIGLEVGLTVDGALEKRNPNPEGQGQIWRNLIGYMKPYQEPFNADGTYTDLDVHPLAWLDEQDGYDHQRNIAINAQLYANWNIPWIKGLKAGVIGNYHYNTFDQKYFRAITPLYSATGALKDPNMADNREMSTSHWWEDVKDLQVNLEYEKAIGDHFFNVQGVYTYTSSYKEQITGNRKGFASPTMDQMDFGASADQKAGGMAYESARLGYVGRLRYSYADKYFIEGNFRYDGSDNFAPNHRWGFFPSAALAWVPSEEKFMQPLKDRHIIDFLKIRLSYGQVGLEEGVNRFGYKTVYYYNEFASVLGGSFKPNIYEGALVDAANLSWFKQNVFDIGFDLYTLNNHLNLTFDYFYYQTKNYLMAPKNRYSTTLGKDLPQVKSNSELRRGGVEFTLRYKNKWEDLNYDLGFNATYYNEMWALDESEDLAVLMNPKQRVSQEKLNWGRLYHSTGIYQNMEDILDSPRRISSNELRPGDLGYQDINGDGKIDDEDCTRYGKPSKPSFDYGFDFNLDYKGIFLYGLFQGTGSRYMMLGGLLKDDRASYMTYKYQMDSWTPQNTDAEYPRVCTEGSPNDGNNMINSDFWIVNASYFRLKTLQVGYDFKYSLLKNVKGISKFRVSLAGTNLFTLSDAMNYFDPETASEGGEAYPVQKTISLVLNIGF